MKKLKQYVQQYRKAINPPYTRRDAPFIGATLFILLVATFFAINLPNKYKSKQTTSSHAQQQTLTGPEYIPDQYIVVLKDKDSNGNKINADIEAEDAVKTHGVKKLHTYKSALNGFSFHGSALAAGALKQNPKVKYVVQDQKVHLEQTATPTLPPLLSTPFTGTPIAIPGIVEAENYDLGGEGVAYHDTDTINTGGVYRNDGVDIIQTPGTTGTDYTVRGDGGEWVKFTVNASRDADYDVTVKTSPSASPFLAFFVDDVYAYQWQVPGSHASIHIPAGVHVVKINFGGSTNLNFLDFQLSLNDAQRLPTGIDRVDAEVATGTNFAPTPLFAVAVIDSGIDSTHPDLNVGVGTDCSGTGTTNDGFGHGTHVAGIIGAKNNSFDFVGVVPGIKLIPVKVFDNSGVGTVDTISCGIDWVATNASAQNIKVANMSLAYIGQDDGDCGNSNNVPWHQAICKSVAAGVTYAVAAGNNVGADEAGTIPAAYDEVITVTALADYDGQKGGLGSPLNTSWCPEKALDDNFASFTNYASSKIDQSHTVGAPGVCITSTYPVSLNSSRILSGTSMASPHVAGAAAMYIGLHPGISPQQVMAAIVNSGEKLGEGHTDLTCYVQPNNTTLCNAHPERVLNLPALYNFPVPTVGTPTPTPRLSPTPTSAPTPIPADSQPPSVSITSPSDGSIVPVGKKIVFNANATDNVKVSKVEFYANGVRKCSDTAAPYTCAYNVGSTIGTVYTVLARAYDGAGNTASKSINVTGGTDTSKPVVILTNPSTGSNVTHSTTVVMSATASDEVGVSKVEFYVNGSRKCSDTTAPYSCNWSVGSTIGTSYTLEARAYDYANNISSSFVNVTSQ